MLESVVGQWAGSAPLNKAKCTIVVYSIDEFIPSQVPRRLHSPIRKVLPPWRRPGAAGVLRALAPAIPHLSL